MPSERIDIVEWLDNSRDTVVSRYVSRFNKDNELKYGSQLIVREGQAACFVNGGRLADVFGPGTYTLETDALPVLSTLQGWSHGFDSPFKAEVSVWRCVREGAPAGWGAGWGARTRASACGSLPHTHHPHSCFCALLPPPPQNPPPPQIYFVSTRVITGMKWGTPNPVIIRDAEFGTIRVRAFGQVSWKVADPTVFLREMVGTDACFKTEEALEYMRSLIVTKVARALGSSGVPIADLAGRQDLLETVIADAIAPDLEALGVKVTRLIVENVSLPPEVEAALDKRTQVAAIGNLDDYTKMQTADAIPMAAGNPNGVAGSAVGMQMGWAMGQQAGARIRDGWAAPPGGGR